MSNFKVILFIIAISILFIATRPDKLPTMNLQYSHEGELSDYGRSIGGKCIAEKCLTVYVSPSCPTTPRLTPMLISLVKELGSEGIQTDIIVGNDPTREVNYLANKYPFDVSLDARGNFFRKANLEFTPTFIVTNSDGEIIKQQSVSYTDPTTMRRKLEL